MALFSSAENSSLERNVSVSNNVVKAAKGNVDCIYEISHCLEWIKCNGFKNVCLQFPDTLLQDAAEVARRIKTGSGQAVFIMGDTTYESCCIDYITAAHVQADAVIQFGPVCFSQQMGAVPHLNIYEKLPLDVEKIYSYLCEFKKTYEMDHIYLLIDTGYYHLQDKLITELKPLHIDVLQIGEKRPLLENASVLFIGNERKLPNIKLIFKANNLYYFPISPLAEPVEFKNVDRILKRRRFLLEKIKDSSTIGIIIGTLAVSNYLKVIERLRKLLSLYKKKYYLMYVGKPSVTKLANFPEVDIYVLVTCSMNELYESRDFYTPIASPYDVEVALNQNATDLEYSFDFNSYMTQEQLDIQKIDVNKWTDVSLLTGQMRSFNNDEDIADTNQTVALKDPGTIVQNSDYGAGYLNKRSWIGLEQNLGQTPVTKAEEGRSGIPQSYANEIS